MLLPSHVRFKIKWCLCLRLFQLSFWLASFWRPTSIKLPLACTPKVTGRLMEFNCISQTFISRFANYYNYYCCCCCYFYYCYYYYYLILLSCIYYFAFVNQLTSPSIFLGKTRIAEKRFLTGLQRRYFFWREGAAIHTQATIKPCRQPLHATEPGAHHACLNVECMTAKKKKKKLSQR